MDHYGSFVSAKEIFREIFERQTQEYRDSVLPPNVAARVAVEQASTVGWELYVGMSGRAIGMKIFGLRHHPRNCRRNSASSPEHVALAAKELLGKR